MDLDKLKKVAEAATPGPWENFRVFQGEEVRAGLDREYPQFVARAAEYVDGRFIATFNPALVVKLLAVVEAAEGLSHYGNCEGDCGNCAVLKALDALKE